MKNTNFKTKLITRIMLLVLLLTSVFSFAGCGMLPYSWEVYSHAEFIKEIEKYNSINNGSVDTFISFDLDSNEDVTQKIYCLKTVVNDTLRKKLGFVDILDKYYTIYQLFYLRSNDNSNQYEYKITCSYDRSHDNFTERDIIEIRHGEHYGSCGGYSGYYQETFDFGPDNQPIRMYNYFYEYQIYVNNIKIGCVHISSIDETSEEKLNEIIQMLYDSLVVINT